MELNLWSFQKGEISDCSSIDPPQKIIDPHNSPDNQLWGECDQIRAYADILRIALIAFLDPLTARHH